MTKDKLIDQDVEEIKRILKEEKTIMGSERVIKELRNGKIKKVFLASNCPEVAANDIEQYCTIAKVELVKLIYPNDELGTICKKPFAISVLGAR